MKIVAVAAAGLTALVLASCSTNSPKLATGSSSTPSSVPPVVAAATTAPASTPAARATPTVWSTAEAGKQYLAIIGPSNADTAQIKALGDDAPVSKYVAASQKEVVDLATLAQQLNAGKWPANAKPQVAALVTSVLQERAIFEQLTASTSLSDFSDTITGQEATLTNGQAAAEAVRLALGLPGN